MGYKLSLFFILLSTVSVAQIADTAYVNYKAENVSLDQIFAELEDEYGIRFSYATSSIGRVLIDVDFKGESLSEVLDYLLADQQMDYMIIDDNVLVRKSEGYQESINKNYKESLHVRGRVVLSKDESSELGYATVAIAGTSLGTYTDDGGRFDIEIPIDHQDGELVIHSMGFEDVIYNIKELDKNFLLVPMSRGGIFIDEVMIVNKQKPIVIGDLDNSINLNQSQLSNSTSGVVGSDLSKQLQMLAGVSANDDASADIKIRGSNSDETMIILDGMPIYSASHYYGIFSSVNTAYIESVKLYKNIYPLEYDGKTGGIVELSSHNDIPDKLKVNLEANLLTGLVDMKMPIGKNSMLSMAGRSTWRDVSNTQFNSFAPESQEEPIIQSFNEPSSNKGIDPSFRFHDINGKFLWNPNVKSSFSFNVYNSQDRFVNDYSRRLKDNQNHELILEAKELSEWANYASSLNWAQQITTSLSLKSRLFYSNYKHNSSNIYSTVEKKNGGNPLPPQSPKETLSSEQSNEINDFGVDSYIEYKKGIHLFKAGLTATKHDIVYDFKDNGKSRISGMDKFYEGGAYVGYLINISEKLMVNAGLRGTYFDLGSKGYLSPRVLASYKVSDWMLVKASFGNYQQFIRQFQYEYRGEPQQLWVSAEDEKIPVLESQNFMVGTTLRIGQVKVDAEFYHKDMNGMIEYAVLNPGEDTNTGEPREYKLWKGKGYSKGLDLIVSAGLGKYDTYLSYTLSKTENRFNQIFNQGYYPTEDDRRHQFKWINTYGFGDFSFDLNGVYISGRRYTDIQNLGPNGNITESNPKDRFTRLPAYQRIDIGANYTFKLGKTKSKVSLSVFNIVNRQNVKYVQSVSTRIDQNNDPLNTVIGSNSNLLSRTLNLSWRVGI